MDVHTYIYNRKLNDIKTALGSKCRHLANRRAINGERFVEATLLTTDGYKKFEFDIPTNLSDIKPAFYDRLEELINSKL